MEARSEMQRAVDTSPTDEWFRTHARDLLEHARRPGRARDHLLVVMQPVRRSVERRAIRLGVPPEVVAETAEAAGHTARLGHFEHDLIHAYLPGYFEQVDRGRMAACFSLHARGAYQDTLRQRRRREARRVALWRRAPEDARTRQELDAGTGATHFAQWVPTPAEVYETRGFLRELEGLLGLLDYQIAALLMKHPIVQGDKGDIARQLSAREGRRISRSRVTRALQNIRGALEQIRVQRGVCRW